MTTKTIGNVETVMTNKSKATQVVVIDDHPILRQGISQLINQERDLAVCGEAGDVPSGLRFLEAHKCDIILLDISLNGKSGIEFLKDIKVQHPKIPVIILSMHDENIYASRALRAGASGYIMKQAAAEKVIEAIRTVLKGEVYLSEKMKAKILNQLVAGKTTTFTSPIEQLSDRELEVFTLLGQGHGTRAISEKLHLSVKTVESHRAHIKEKLKLKSAMELIHNAIHWAQSENLQSKKDGSMVVAA
jgi:DNA-binding NarL/FixJ family response regulator